MLIKESVWLGNNIKSLNPNNVFPMLDLGSNSRKYREKLQPWIEKNIFKEPKRLGFKIIYTDQKNLPGVDLVGNIYNPKFQEKLSKLKIKSIMCSNLLEHIEDRESLAKFITKILPKQGYLFLSGPYRYRHHGDPIDTMFRPTVDELHQLFPTLKKNQRRNYNRLYLHNISSQNTLCVHKIYPKTLPTFL